jgi:hydrogenase/urease accessory protein HupE
MRLWLILFCWLGLALGAAADELKPGYLELAQTPSTGALEHWRVTWKAPIKAGLAGKVQPRFPAFCQLKLDQTGVQYSVVVTTVEMSCARPLVGQELRLEGLENTVSDVLVRVAPLGQPVQAARLTAAETRMEIKARPDRWNVARTYFGLGVEHILFGFDHLLFVLSLVLLLKGGWRIAKTITSFTLAHSITLAGATLGFIGLPRPPVESVIALSIIFLAVEIVKSDGSQTRLSERYPWVVAFGFGLLHGFGFAGALAEIGLPQGEVPAALLTFNLGVEAGQLLIVAAALAVIWAVQRLAPRQLQFATKLSAYAIGGLASAWFIGRTLF